MPGPYKFMKNFKKISKKKECFPQFCRIYK